MSSVPKHFLTPEQYLAQERKADFKSEYYQGETFAMAGATREHNLIVGNILGEVRNALKNRSCEVYPSDIRVKVSPTGLYTYPDVTVVCGEPQLEDDCFDTLLNPTVLFEVLSESTESYDRGAKFRQYRQIESLQEYVIVALDRPSVECYVKQLDGRWLLLEAFSLEQSVTFESLEVSIPLAEVYRHIAFEEDSQSHE